MRFANLSARSLPYEGATLIYDIAPLEGAGPGDISLFSSARYLDVLKFSRARAIIVGKDAAHRLADHPAWRVLVDNPRLAFAQVGQLFYPPVPLEPAIDVTARVHPDAQIGVGSRIEAGAIIGNKVEIGERCHVGFNAVLSDGVKLGSECRIGANVCISHAVLGERITVDTGSIIGAAGFGFVPTGHGLTRMLQLGRVLIGDDVQIGANCAIDRGATGDTVIGAGTVLDNLVHIAHNVSLGRNCIICAQVGIAGSTVAGEGVMMGGQVGVADHLMIGKRAQIAAKAGVVRDVVPGSVVGGFPAMAIKAWHRQTIGLARLFRPKQSDRTE
ncbi:MAG: UDP-3-O-(3-hydroxymyristoyl)glucosamine N-acyltransferase [Hyphomicrobium sp.]|nr:UDP-3-O-(3-hydroxymyristoyl)glucosamine N-acyltransferase [Hyphomicrobium sp.]